MKLDACMTSIIHTLPLGLHLKCRHSHQREDLCSADLLALDFSDGTIKASKLWAATHFDLSANAVKALVK